MEITATYSPEDNKLRLYASQRLDAETYARVKDAGFKWAPRQELFVAPKWTPAREDLALDLAGEIEAEEMTLAERAQMKAERLDNLAAKRFAEASAFSRAARDISERFAYGQPILVGHHSERKARKDKERMESADNKAHKAHDLGNYWLYRAEGVERHANYKNDPRTRARRIKTLLADLRDLQRRLNTAHKMREAWTDATEEAQILALVGGGNVSYDLYSQVDKGEVTPQEARERLIAAHTRTIESPILSRWINHTLNRLSFEREMLGEVPRFAGEITPTMLQMFVREHGADKPKGAKVDDDLFTIECDAPLPAHIADGATVELSGDEWRDLMRECGYVPPAKKPSKPPILNFASPTGFLHVKNNATFRGADPVKVLPVAEMSKADYSAINSDYRGTRLSPCGQFRVRITLNPNHTGPACQRGWAVIHITDQKTHPTPESAVFNAPEAAA